MKLAAKEALKKLQLKHYNSIQSETEQFRQMKPFFTMPDHVEKESGVLAPKRINHVEQFKKYTYNVLPALEQTVELDLLNKIFHKVDPVVRESIAQSYVRKYVESLVQSPDQTKMNGQEDDSESNVPQEKSQIFDQIDYDEWELDPINVGMWYPFKAEEFKKNFKYKSPGDFDKNLLKYSRNFSLQMTFDGFRVMDYVNSSFRETYMFDDPEIEHEDLQTEAGFVLMFNALKGDLQEQLLKHRKNEIFQRLFATSVNFDALIITLLDNPELYKQWKTQQDRQQFCESLVEQLLQKVDKKQANASMPELLFKTVKSLQFKDYTVDLTKYVDNPFPVPQSMIEERWGDQYYGWGSTMLFYGDHGAGKSGVLMQAIMYAVKQRCIVAVVPSGYDWTSLKYETVRHNQTGLYMQPKAAQEWLEQFRDANEELLKDFKIKPELYGKFNLSGVHDDDPDPCPNFFDERRQYHFKDYQKFQSKEELAFEEAQDQVMSARITLKLPNPVLLTEIIDFGIQNANYATNAVYEVMEQLYNTEENQVLVVVDGINWFYKPSQIPSFRYDSDKGLRGHIPPYHMSLPRLFMHFDGHKIRNGTKLTASSIYPYFQHDFQPKHVLLPQKYGIKLNGAPLDIFRMFCEYCLQTGVWKCDDYAQATVEQFWMETQGNFAETVKCMREHWRDL